MATIMITVANTSYVEKPVAFGFNGYDGERNGDIESLEAPQTLSLDGAVLDAVFDIHSLNSLADLLTSEGIVLSAANGIRSLGGLTSLDAKGAVVETIRAERAREIEFRAGYERSFQDVRLDRLPGFSLRSNVPGNLGGLSAREQIVIESLVRDQTLMVQISNTIELGQRNILEYRITQRNGGELPKWLDKAGPDLLIGRHDAHVESIELRIEAIYSDGTHVTEDVRIDVETGEIQMLASDHAEQAAPQLFSDQFQTQPMLTDDQVEDLGRALGR